jgi:hypothetical protein
MLDDMQLETEVRELILDVCQVLYKYGYEAVSVGAMMRLVGVSHDKAMEHDDMLLVLDDSFQDMIKMREQMAVKQAPLGSTLH